MYSLRMAAGFSAATCSISMPPAADAMNTGLACRAINHDSEIKFFLDGQSFFDQQPANHAAFGPGLMRHQRHAQHLARQFGRFFHRLGDLHAAALAAAAGMNLGFHHHAGRAGVEQASSRPLRPASRVSTISPRGTATPYFFRIVLGLVLMNFHNDSRPKDHSVCRHDLACSLGQRVANL